MLAIYKRELKSYLTSMVGYLFMFFVLLIAGIYFSAYQLSAAYPKFEYTLNAMTFVFLIAVPILTMRVLAEERKQKTDQLLLTSPVSVSGINPYCSSGNLSADHVKVRNRCIWLCVHSTPWIFPSGKCKHCNWRIFLSNH